HRARISRLESPRRFRDKRDAPRTPVYVSFSPVYNYRSLRRTRQLHPHAWRRAARRATPGGRYPKKMAAHREDSTDETTGFSQGGGCRDGDVRGCRSGHRAVDARAAMAADGELAEIARHALWRARIHG